ncbi:MAG: hypothetical protein ACLFNT_05985 [Spirochaetales bacterium]
MYSHLLRQELSHAHQRSERSSVQRFERITAEEKRRIRTAGTAAYLMAFLTNMTFIILSYIRGSVDYETGFYLAYIMGSVTFPATSFLMEAPYKLRRVREQRRERLSAADR